MQYLNEIQTALLFDGRVDTLEQVVGLFLRAEEERTGAKFNIPEARKGAFYRMFSGGQNLMVTLEYVDRPANQAVFKQALGSVFTTMACPDMAKRIARHRCHVLATVSHGVFGGVAKDPKIAAMFDQIGLKEGQSLPLYKARLEALASLTRIVHRTAPATVVHWTPSNNLLAADAFVTLAGAGGPGPLHVHPYLFGASQGPDGKPRLGIRSFGARHFIGCELLVEPSILPWSANFETMLTFLRVATVENGYIIPDGDVFGPEDGSVSYRVLHRAAAPGDVPIIELVPLIHREFGFQAEGYVKPPRIIDDRNPPAELMPAEPEAQRILTEAWREKRALAEAIGGRLQVRGPGGGAGAPAPSSGGWLPRIFGRGRSG